MRVLAIIIPVALFSACNQQPAENQTNVEQAVAQNEPIAQPAANVTAPDENASLPEPQGPIDPTSDEAAGQVVQHYGALIEQGRWAQAEALWDHAESAKQFTAGLKRNFGEIHLEIGKPGDMEGAAGSIFVTEPVFFYGKKLDGSAFRSPANIILRRVNDVPGSTEAQRRWHIDRIEGQDTGEN